MKNKTTEVIQALSPAKKGLRLFLTHALATLVCWPVLATDRFHEFNRDDEETHYQQSNLVSDISGVAQLQDTNLVNAWGIAFGPTGPFWIGNNGSGTTLNISSNLTLNDIASSAHMSVTHFCNLFRLQTGFSPIEYFNHLKVQQACQTLAFTSRPIKEIADELGFSDQYYFSRMFSRLMGMSPSQYRKRNKTIG